MTVVIIRSRPWVPLTRRASTKRQAIGVRRSRMTQTIDRADFPGSRYVNQLEEDAPFNISHSVTRRSKKSDEPIRDSPQVEQLPPSSEAFATPVNGKDVKRNQRPV